MNTSALIPDPTTAARVGAALIGSTALFQVALAAGTLWGAAAWGGQHPGVLTTAAMLWRATRSAP